MEGNACYTQTHPGADIAKQNRDYCKRLKIAGRQYAERKQKTSHLEGVLEAVYQDSFLIVTETKAREYEEMPDVLNTMLLLPWHSENTHDFGCTRLILGASCN